MPLPATHRQHHRSHHTMMREDPPAERGFSAYPSSYRSGRNPAVSLTVNRHNRTKEIKDDQIVRGAEILRHQIAYRNHRGKEGSTRMQMQNRPDPVSLGDDSPRKVSNITYETCDDDSDWSDPVPPPKGLGRRNSGYISATSDEGNEQEEFKAEKSDDDTTAILSRAKLLAQSNQGMYVPIDELKRPNKSSSEFKECRENGSLVNADFAAILPSLACGGNSYLPSQLECSFPRRSPPVQTKSEPESEFFVCHNTLDLLRDLQNEEQQLAQKRNHSQSLSSSRDDTPGNVPGVSRKKAETRESAEKLLPFGYGSTQLRLMNDPGFRHAQRAGILWQSLVSQHVRFPSKWWDGARSPSMGVEKPKKWLHMGRHRVRDNPFLQKLLHNRACPGRLLLHLIVRDVMTGEPILDVAVGGFHPSARGIRTTFAADPYLDTCRDMWLALRPRTEYMTSIESLLRSDREPEQSPLGPKQAVTNENLRPVFGERPPVHTIMVQEAELYDLLFRRDMSIPVAAVLLYEFFDEW